MEFLEALPIVWLAVLIFFLRLIDVPLGTFRTISVVQGQVRLAVVLGFFEVSIWTLAISQVVSRVSHSPLLVLFYAGGFAAGNAAGIALERRLSRGIYTLRVISGARAQEIISALREQCTVLAVLNGESPEGPVNLIYLSSPRRQLADAIRTVKEIDPEVHYIVDRAQVWSDNLQPIPNPTGWRAIVKKK